MCILRFEHPQVAASSLLWYIHTYVDISLGVSVCECVCWLYLCIIRGVFGHQTNKQTAHKQKQHTAYTAYSKIASMEAIMTLASFYEPRNDYQFGNTAFDLRDSVAIVAARNADAHTHTHRQLQQAWLCVC